MSAPCLWSPSQEQTENSQLYTFTQAVNKKFSTNFHTYDELYQWSVKHRERFWSFWADYCGFPFFTPATETVTSSEKMNRERWFVGATTNYTQKILEYKGDDTAILSLKEDGECQGMSYSALMDNVAQAQQALRVLDIKKGDRVAGFMPNTAQTVIMMLACASLGIIWSSCSPDFGVQTVLDRFGQIRPKLLITADGYQYAGKRISIEDKNRQIIKAVDSIEHLVTVPFLDSGYVENRDNVSGSVTSFLWCDFLGLSKKTRLSFEVEPVPFNHPLYILYSSGTTGTPKCMAHGHGGTLLQHLKEHRLHTNINKGDRVFYFTTCGWMMWNWLVSVLASGACAVLYDGSPFHPGPERLWQLVEQYNINVFGTSASYLAALSRKSYYPKTHHNLCSLKTLLSTGSPLAPDTFDFVYQHIKTDLCLSSISGGTDIVSCFVLGCPALPVYRGEIQCRGLGMDVSFVDEKGNNLVDEKGEMVCRQGFPSMPVCFWNDANGKKYHKAYFSRFDGVWTHGDYGKLTRQGGIILYGRSDTTLNPGGVRIGTAEIYRQVNALKEIKDSLAVGRKWKDDEQVVLFVILNDGYLFEEELRLKIRETLKNNASPRHVPSKIIEVTDFPRTLSGKTSEVAVRNAINNESVTNRNALANPEALSYFSNIF